MTRNSHAAIAFPDSCIIAPKWNSGYRLNHLATVSPYRSSKGGIQKISPPTRAAESIFFSRCESNRITTAVTHPAMILARSDTNKSIKIGMETEAVEYSVKL